MRQRITIFVVLVLLSIIFLVAIYGAYFHQSKEERIQDKSREVVERLLDSREEGEIISEAEDPAEVMKDVHAAFGEYFTDEYTAQVEEAIVQAMTDGRDFKENPARITFFLIHKGDGFQFSKPERTTYEKATASADVGVIHIIVSPDDYEWVGRELGLPYLEIVKDGSTYKIKKIVK
ncbi:MAG TPA: hypothetical protein VK144_08365 [Bacillota bacterium]|nr:hypothetical protein [Bacillota bacterium]